MNCYCKSGIEYNECCKKVATNGAKDALELMKSRYSAYCTSDMEYIKKTSTKDMLNQLDVEFLKNWSKNSIWQHLEIVEYVENSDTSAIVEFKAYYIYDKAQRCHHERSEFVKEENTWLYSDGNMIESNLKLERNDLCICGSDKKYKKCCLKKI
jgi:SEC-C motif-containing protein